MESPAETLLKLFHKQLYSESAHAAYFLKSKK